MSAATWTLIAHVSLAAALLLSNGMDHSFAELLLVAACASVGCALAAVPLPWRTNEQAPRALALGVALASTLAAFVRPPGAYVSTSLAPYDVLSACAIGLVASYIPEVRTGRPPSGRLARARPYAMLALALALGAWMLHASPAPRIDVWPIHQQGARALLDGRSPYARGAIATADTFHESQVIDTYGYPPLNALLTAAAYALTGETRWAALVAIVAGGYLAWLVARRGVEGGSAWPDLLLASFLFNPRGLFVLEQAWGDPLSLPFLAGFTLAAKSGRRRLAAVLLGLLCSIKQHFVIYGIVLILTPGIGASGALLALATAAATYAPFVIASPRETWQALVEFHMRGSFRADSLSLAAMIAHRGIVLPSWAGIVATCLFLAVVPRLPRTQGMLLLASAAAFLVFYVLGRQAFCNYYYVVCQTLLLAAAAASEPDTQGSTVGRFFRSRGR